MLDDVLSHQVDLVCWMLGAVPDEVRAVVSASARGAVHAELRIGSLVAHCHAAHAPYAERLEIEMVDGTVLEASGSGMRSTGNRLAKGRRYRALVMDRLALVGARLRRQPNVTLASFERQLRDFEQAVRGGRSEGATAEDGAPGRGCRAGLPGERRDRRSVAGGWAQR